MSENSEIHAGLELPVELERRMEAMLGAEMPAFRAALAAPPVGLRVNTLRLPASAYRDVAPFGLRPLAHPPEGFVVDEQARPGRHPHHAAGLYYLQDPGAMVVGALVDPSPGEWVLDLAAAPGGKTTHLASRMRGEGLLLANDVHPGRARELAGNLERFGARNAIVTSEPIDRLATRLGDVFDRVLLDAPCSGESMFHKSEAARAGWSPAAVAGCARRQSDLLDDAARLVRPGGLLVYSTCTFAPEENEGVVATFLARQPEFEMVPLPGVPGAAPAEPAWVAPELRRSDLRHAVRLWPHRVPGAGHFVAGLRRTGGTEAPARHDGGARSAPPLVPIGDPAPAAAVEALRELLGSCTLPRDPDPAAESRASGRGVLLGDADVLEAGPLAMLGEQLYLVPPAAPALDRVRVERAGLWLGTFRKGRLDPAHALAMALDPARLATPVALTAGTPEIAAYLGGETLRDDGPDGWAVVTVDGFAIGWGKRVRGVVKNHYPRGLRVRG